MVWRGASGFGTPVLTSSDKTLKVVTQHSACISVTHIKFTLRHLKYMWQPPFYQRLPGRPTHSGFTRIKVWQSLQWPWPTYSYNVVPSPQKDRKVGDFMIRLLIIAYHQLIRWQEGRLWENVTRLGSAHDKNVKVHVQVFDQQWHFRGKVHEQNATEIEQSFSAQSGSASPAQWRTLSLWIFIEAAGCRSVVHAALWFNHSLCCALGRGSTVLMENRLTGGISPVKTNYNKPRVWIGLKTNYLVKSPCLATHLFTAILWKDLVSFLLKNIVGSVPWLFM